MIGMVERILDGGLTSTARSPPDTDTDTSTLATSLHHCFYATIVLSTWRPLTILDVRSIGSLSALN
jgi:hypothetical protein